MILLYVEKQLVDKCLWTSAFIAKPTSSVFFWIYFWKKHCQVYGSLLSTHFHVSFYMGYTIYATTHNNPQPPTTSQSYPEPPTTTQKTTHNPPENHPQLPTTIHKYPKVTQKSQNLSQLCYCTLDVNTETDVAFDSDMKQWYIYMCACVSVCIYFLRHYIYYFFVRMIACFCQH